MQVFQLYQLTAITERYFVLAAVLPQNLITSRESQILKTNLLISRVKLVVAVGVNKYITLFLSRVTLQWKIKLLVPLSLCDLCQKIFFLVY